MVAVVRDVKKQKALGQAAKNIAGKEPSIARTQDIDGSPSAGQHTQSHPNFDSHHEVRFGRKLLVDEILIQPAPKNLGKRMMVGRAHCLLR